MELTYFKLIAKHRENREYLFPTLRICRVVSGSFGWQIGKEVYALKSGDLVLLNNLVSRKILNPDAQSIEIDVFEFLPGYVQSKSALLSMFYGINPVKLSEENRKAINALLSVIAESYGRIEKTAVFDCIMQAVFALLEEAARCEAREQNSLITAIDAMGFVWSHYSEDISVPAVAAHLHVSKSQLEKQFKRVHGISVGAYIRMIRVYNVTTRLNKKPEESVLEAALACGFNSSSGFYKAYKAVTGENPRRKKEAY